MTLPALSRIGDPAFVPVGPPLPFTPVPGPPEAALFILLAAAIILSAAPFILDAAVISGALMPVILEMIPLRPLPMTGILPKIPIIG